MSVNTKNDYVSVNEDIKQISQELLEEGKTNKTILVRYYQDKTDNAPSVCYKRFESIPYMQEWGFLKILLPIKKSRYLRNLFPFDSAIIESPIYQVEINSNELVKFLQNPDIGRYLKEKAPPDIYNPEDLRQQHGKLSIIRRTESTVYLYYEGLKPSEPISKKAAWLKVFCDFMEDKRLQKQDIMATWNTASKSKYNSTKKTRSGYSYVSKVRQQILAGLLRASPEIARHIKMEKGKESYRGSYSLSVD